jgi:hypothetical protein
VTNFVLTEPRRPILRGLKKNQVSPFSNTNTLLQVGFSLLFCVFFFFFFWGGGLSGTCQPLGSSHWRWKKAF